MLATIAASTATGARTATNPQREIADHMDQAEVDHIVEVVPTMAEAADIASIKL